MQNIIQIVRDSSERISTPQRTRSSVEDVLEFGASQATDQQPSTDSGHVVEQGERHVARGEVAEQDDRRKHLHAAGQLDRQSEEEPKIPTRLFRESQTKHHFKVFASNEKIFYDEDQLTSSRNRAQPQRSTARCR